MKELQKELVRMCRILRKLKAEKKKQKYVCYARLSTHFKTKKIPFFFFGNRNESSVNYGYEIISQQKTTLEVPSFSLK